jgi:hypothetical protein
MVFRRRAIKMKLKPEEIPKVNSSLAPDRPRTAAFFSGTFTAARAGRKAAWKQGGRAINWRLINLCD